MASRRWLLVPFCIALLVSACAKKPPKTPKGFEEDDDTSSAGESDADDYDAAKAKAKKFILTRDHGTIVVLRFINEKTKKTLSLIYLDEGNPKFNDKIKSWTMLPKATAGEKQLSVMTVIARRLKVGNPACGDNTLESAVGVSMGPEEWDGKAGTTSWTLNTGSHCEFEFHAAAKDGDLEGTFKGKLPSNDEKNYLMIDKGWIYIRQVPAGAEEAPAAAPDDSPSQQPNR